MPKVRDWLRTATSREVVRRALCYATVVGTVLITINYSDLVLAGEVRPRHLLKMSLTMLVPYCVSTASSVGAIRQLRRAAPAATAGSSP